MNLPLDLSLGLYRGDSYRYEFRVWTSRCSSG